MVLTNTANISISDRAVNGNRADGTTGGTTLSGQDQPHATILDALSALSDSTGWLKNDGAGTLAWTTPTKADVGLSNVLNVAQEPALGNPSTDGYVLSSTAAGVRSWIAGGGPSGADPTASIISNSANNGSATTFMRSDATPAISTSAVFQFARIGLGVAADGTAPLLLPNNTWLSVLDTGGAARSVVGIDSSNNVFIGSAGSSCPFFLNVGGLAQAFEVAATTGNAAFASTTDATAYNAASVVLAGGLGVTGNVCIGVGQPTPNTAIPLYSTSATTTVIFFGVTGYASSATAGANMRLCTDDGAAMASGDMLGHFDLGGVFDGSHATFAPVQFSGYAAENWSSGARGSYATINNTAAGSTAVVERLRVTAAGNLLVGTTSESGLTGAGGLSIASTTDATAYNAASVVLAGGLGVTKTAIFNGTIKYGGTFLTDQGHQTLGMDLGLGSARAAAILLATPYGATPQGIDVALVYDGVDGRWEHAVGSGNAYGGALLFDEAGGYWTFSQTTDSAANGAAATVTGTLQIYSDSVRCLVPLRLANSYAAGAPTATGYLTLEDSTGTTYKVLVST